MFSGTVKYLLDANAIRSLSANLIGSKRNNNRILATIHEVKTEVPDRHQSKVALLTLEALISNDYMTMQRIIGEHDCVKILVDYYQNKGAADIALLAHALTASGAMFEDEVVIVTDDGNLRIACGELSVRCLTADEFSVI